MLPLALLAIAGAVTAAIKLTGGPNLSRVAAGLSFPLQYVQLAAKWASKRGLPLEWVLATILVESSGNPRAAGDADGRSAGLMQVNTSAHAAEMAAKRVTREMMFDPAVNIEWGTKYMAEFRANILKALGGRRPPAPLDEILRLSYKGPATVYAALRAGRNPADISWAPAALVNWRRAMARVTALTKGRLQA
jgi:soluble lytic murein transglycosylase-like protein